MLSRTHDKLDMLLREAHAEYKAEVENKIYIRSSFDNYQGWRSASSRTKRPLSSVVLPKRIKQRLVLDAKDFLASERWYAERGIPWRRGYLLHGSPGSGKTSLIFAIAGELDLDIYVFSLAKRGMDDDDLMDVINSLPRRSIALMEDIDAAFTRGISRDAVGASEQDDEATSPEPSQVQQQERPQGGITLAGLLAAIDGVSAQEGRILFATTNDRSALDLALCRPGRLDVHFEFRRASKEQAEELFKHFYLPGQGYEGKPSTLSKETSVVDEKIGLLVEVEDEAGYVNEKRDLVELSSAELSQLAKQFSALIPEEEFSMATLQGHLMQFKKRPWDVIRDTPEWIETERAAKKEWEETRRRRANPTFNSRLQPGLVQDRKPNTAPTTITNSPVGEENELQESTV